MKNKTWFNSPRLAFFILSAITIVLFSSALKIKIGESTESKYIYYSVEFDFYGVDQSKIEQIITSPLEEKLSSLTFLKELRSTVEYGKSTTTACFSKKADSKKVYLEIRNIVDTIYEDLPNDVQKPRIYSSTAGAKSVISISFSCNSNINELRDSVERKIKRKFESIDGVSEVIISGGSQTEYHVSFDADKTALLNENPQAFSSIIQDGNSVNAGAKLQLGSTSKNLIFNTRLHSIDDIKKLPVKIAEGYTTLEHVAEVSKSYRSNDEIVRVNGNECVTANVISSSQGNSILISKKCKQILMDTDFSGLNCNYKILYDNGKEQIDSIKSILISLLESFICVLIIIPFFYKSKRIIVIMLIALPLSCVWTTGILELFSYNLNKQTIAGISIALGLIIDPFIIITNFAETSFSREQFILKTKDSTKSIVTSTLTTILVLVPLAFFDSIVPGVKTISITITIMLISSVVISIVFLPCFIYSSEPQKSFIPENILKDINRFFIRSSYKISLCSVKNMNTMIAIYILLILIPVPMFAFLGKNISTENENNIIYCSFEFAPETTASYIDSTIMPCINEISEHKNFMFVKSKSTSGTAELEIGLEENASKIEETKYLSKFSNYFPEAFFYLPELGKEKTKEHSSFEIAAIGDEDEQCREYAKEAANILSSSKEVTSVVLNFKQDKTEIEFNPIKDKLFSNNLNVESLSSILRWCMFGPVADKYIQNGKEYDIRVLGDSLQKASLEKIQNLYIPTGDSSSRLTSFVDTVFTKKSGNLFKKDGRHAAFFTVETDGKSTDKSLSTIKSYLSKIPLKKGFAFSFSHEITEMSQNYKLLATILFLSIVSIYILLTALTENLKKSALILSIIPCSTVIPLIFLFVTQTPLQLGDVIGIIILSGISVNNAIYLSESKHTNAIYIVRDKTLSILTTSLTTILGCIPLLISSANDSFSKNMSFFMCLGILDSVIVVFLLFPALLSFKKPQYRNNIKSLI